MLKSAAKVSLKNIKSYYRKSLKVLLILLFPVTATASSDEKSPVEPEKVSEVAQCEETSVDEQKGIFEHYESESDRQISNNALFIYIKKS